MSYFYYFIQYILYNYIVYVYIIFVSYCFISGEEINNVIITINYVSKNILLKKQIIEK